MSTESKLGIGSFPARNAKLKKCLNSLFLLGVEGWGGCVVLGRNQRLIELGSKGSRHVGKVQFF